MKIDSLELRDFRNHGSTSVTFDDGVNVITGGNGQGKTNLLESIFLFASGKSFRGQADREMIRFGYPEAYIKLCFTDRFASHKLEMYLYKNKKRVLYKDGCVISRLSEYLGLFRAVVFTPDHLRIVKSSPEHRRRLADIAICQTFPRYVASLSEYNRLMIQKNNLLKAGITRLSEPMLDVYNEKLASLSAVITLNRYNYVSRLGEKAAEYMSEMTDGKEKLTLSYSSQYGDEYVREKLCENCLALFEKKKEAEITKKVSLYGCNHDDFGVMINGKDARSYGSQGQQRSAVLAIKLAEGELAKTYTGEESVFLFDDVLSELDSARRAYMTEKLQGRQFIMTGCDSGYETNGKIKTILISEGKTI